MEEADLTGIETSITSLREDSDYWQIETLSAIKFRLHKKWKVRPFLGQPLKLYIAKGGRIHTIYISQRLMNIFSDPDPD